jgi:hypothetical protein
LEGLAYRLSFLVGGQHLGIVLVCGFLDVGVLDLVGRADVGVLIVGVCRCRFKCRFLVGFSLKVCWATLCVFLENYT